jgi:TPR repeat protein
MGLALAGMCMPSHAGDRITRAVQALRNDRLDDDDHALATLRELAASGDAEAQYNLGVAFLNGVGCHAGSAEGGRPVDQGGGAGHVNAQYKLGHSYREARGVDSDAGKAF